MENNFEKQVNTLRKKVDRLLRFFSNADVKADNFIINISDDFREEFLKLIDKVNLSLIEDKENFYGYFMFQLERDIRFDINSPTGTNFKGVKYVIYFNPLLFLNLTLKQMESTIKHEILHIISMHLFRARELKGSYSKLAINMAMDVVVNKYLTNLWPYATTLEWVNLKYSLSLRPYETFEYYAKELQMAIDLQEEPKDTKQSDTFKEENLESEYDPKKTHDIWEESTEMEIKTIQAFTEKAVNASKKGEISSCLEGLLDSLKNSRGELPWNIYLNRLMGIVESNKKKTVTRRNRRQPDRLDLRGELRSHKAKIIVAIDISGSIGEEEFKNAIVEVLSIVKNYGHEIIIVECDDKIRRIYKINSQKDMKERLNTGGSTKFTPVFEYANQTKVNLLIYFTDGKGEDRLEVTPKGYQVLWVISGNEDELSVKEPYGAVKKLKVIESKEHILDITEVERGGYSMNNQENSL